MGFNMYNQIPKIRADLEGDGHKKDIPVDVFGEYLMLKYGMKKNTAVRWISLFQAVNLIKVNDGSINFIGGKE